MSAQSDTLGSGLLRSETVRGIWVVGYREVVRFISDRSRIIGSLFFPLLMLVVFGAGSVSYTHLTLPTN